MNESNTLALRQADNARPMTRTARDTTASRTLPSEASIARLAPAIDEACARIAPLWPLKHFVAVNPFFGLRDQRFEDAAALLARVADGRLYLPRDYVREQWQCGRITRRDLIEALERSGTRIELATIEQALSGKTTAAEMPKITLVTDVLDQLDPGEDWSAWVTERVSLFCAAYFDLGQAPIPLPNRERSLFGAWREATAIDRTPDANGLAEVRRRAGALPDTARATIAWAIERLGIPQAATAQFLHAVLLRIGGWAAWARYQRWQAELAGKTDDAIVDLLAVRLAWETLLLDSHPAAALGQAWRKAVRGVQAGPSVAWREAAAIDQVLLSAMEIGYQRGVIGALSAPTGATARPQQVRPAVQAAFCIDVRSEVFRRALETVTPMVQTLGFAGFFGIPIEYVPLGARAGRSHVPVLLNPAYRVYERASGDDASVATLRRERLGFSKAWKQFKFSAASCFSFVEAAGLMYAPKLLADSFGWTRPVADPGTQGLDARVVERIGPQLSPATPELCCPGHDHTGIPEADRAELAERILRAMSMTEGFARLVLLAGHGSTSVNNPHATGLDCGACAGQTGEASARVVVALLNEPAVRKTLRERGLAIPEDTHFLAALHDTTTDEVRVFDADGVPDSHAEDLAQLRTWLAEAGELTRMQRAALLGIEGQPAPRVAGEVRRRSRDWSQVRPEWALANNAAFIAAPRARTQGVDLGGRAFLHDYDWRKDEGFGILELIMTAPMVVANWINMQYYGSTVDNARFGSGNKVLHNITGGAIGVLEGNGGDLRVGLPLQSLHDGEKWVHEPLRLSVFLEAPAAAIDDVIARHPTVRELIDNGWLHLFRIDDATIQRRTREGTWENANPTQAEAA